MKLNLLIFTILITGLFSCQDKKNEVIITGTINGDIPEKVNYTVPVNKFCDLAFNKSVHPDSLGNFTITLDIEEASFVQIFIPQGTYGTLLVEKGMNYNVTFNSNLKEKQFKVVSDNSKAQNLYNTFPNPGCSNGARKFFKDSMASEVKSKLKSLEDNEIALFEELLNKGEISEDFFSLVELDRSCYYSVIQGTVALMMKYNEYSLNNGAFTNEMHKMWDESFVKTPPMPYALIRSKWSFSLLDNFLMYKEYNLDSFSFDELDKTFQKGLMHTHKLEEAKKFLHKDMLEYYIACYLNFENSRKEDQKNLLIVFNEFKKEFPNSKFMAYIEPLFSPKIEFSK